MKPFLKSLQIVVKRRDSLTVLIGSTLFFFLSILLLEKGPTLLGLTNLNFSWLEKTTLIFSYLFDTGSSFTLGSFVLIILGSVLSGINIAFVYTYFTTRAKVLMRTNLYSGIGLIFSLLGVGCAACGTALLSTLLGLVGFSSILGFLPYQGLEVGYIGLAILMLATISLAKKVIAPNIC